MALHCIDNVRFNPGGVPVDARLARLTDLGVGAISFLHHRSDEAGELCDFPFKDFLAKIQIAENAVKRVTVLVVRRRFKKGARYIGPVVCRGDGQRVFTLEMMKECTLGHASLSAERIYRGRRIAFLTNQRKGSIQQLLSSPCLSRNWRGFSRHEQNIPTGWYVVNTLPRANVRYFRLNDGVLKMGSKAALVEPVFVKKLPVLPETA